MHNLLSLEIFEEAVNNWNTHALSCCVCLGDQIDGKTRTDDSQSSCLNGLKGIASHLEAPLHFCFGNHDYYTFSREQLKNYFIPESIVSCSPTKLYYDWTPHPGWRFILLDSYDVSLIGYSTEQHLMQARSILKKNNPNDLSIPGGWFKNLPREKHRYVPYNGGISSSQLLW